MAPVTAGQKTTAIFRYVDGLIEISTDLGETWYTQESAWVEGDVDAVNQDVFIGKNGSTYLDGMVADYHIADHAYTRAELVSFGTFVAGNFSCVEYTEPVVDSVEPFYGIPGDTMTIHGSGFTGATGVYWEEGNSDPADQMTFNVVNDSTIGFTLVANPRGAYFVVANPLHTYASGVPPFYFYSDIGAITSGDVYPDTGTITESDTVNIQVSATDSGYGSPQDPGITAVFFNNIPATSFTYDKDGYYQISAVVPSGLSAGPVDVRIENPYFNNTGVGVFTYA